jgi:hypothetical protein
MQINQNTDYKLKNMKKITHLFIIGTFVMLYLMVSVISTIHVVDFFQLSNPTWLAITLAIAFEVGAAASLASIIVMDKMNKTLVWLLFIVITLMQMQGNMYYAFVNLKNYQSWSELFALVEEDPIFQKRILAAVSGAILPLVALGFIKSLVDYIKPSDEESTAEVKAEPESEPKLESSEDTSYATGYKSNEKEVQIIQDEIQDTEEEIIQDIAEEPLSLLTEENTEEQKKKVD